MNTFSYFHHSNQHYLVPGEVMKEPNFLSYFDRTPMSKTRYEIAKQVYNSWLTSKTGWLLIPEQHVHLWKGRTGIPESEVEVKCLQETGLTDYGGPVPPPQYVVLPKEREEEETEFQVLLMLENELVEINKLSFPERVEARREILTRYTIKRKQP